jgi:hypothetical protein
MERVSGDGCYAKEVSDLPKGRQSRTPGRGEQGPFEIRLPGFHADEAVGLGDTLKRVSAAIGIRPCGGCGRRAEALNRRVVFTGRSRGVRT